MQFWLVFLCFLGLKKGLVVWENRASPFFKFSKIGLVPFSFLIKPFLITHTACIHQSAQNLGEPRKFGNFYTKKRCCGTIFRDLSLHLWGSYSIHQSAQNLGEPRKFGNFCHDLKKLPKSLWKWSQNPPIQRDFKKLPKCLWKWTQNHPYETVQKKLPKSLWKFIDN